MQIAEIKRKNNISEYIIHMYQTEDLIRIYNFDMEMISEYVIKHIPAKDKDKQQLKNWYQGIADQMKREQIEERGHLAEVQEVVKELITLKSTLIKEDPDFEKIYKPALPYIKETMTLSKGAVKNEIQACINGIYGLLLARINGKKIPPELIEGIEHFGNVLSYLSYKYKQIHS